MEEDSSGHGAGIVLKSKGGRTDGKKKKKKKRYKNKEEQVNGMEGRINGKIR